MLQAVGDVSFAVNAGEVFGLLGPNGAGKTTCMRMVIAEEAPTRGQVRGERVGWAEGGVGKTQLTYRTVIWRSKKHRKLSVTCLPPNRINKQT